MRMLKRYFKPAIVMARNATLPMAQTRIAPSGMIPEISQVEKLGMGIRLVGKRSPLHWLRNGLPQIKFSDEQCGERKGSASDDCQVGEI